MTPQTIDVTGLPEPVVQHLRALVESIRGGPTATSPSPEQLTEWERLRLEVAAKAAAHPSNTMTSEEWIAAHDRFVAEHGVRGANVDVSRESFYEGRE